VRLPNNPMELIESRAGARISVAHLERYTSFLPVIIKVEG